MFFLHDGVNGRVVHDSLRGRCFPGALLGAADTQTRQTPIDHHSAPQIDSNSFQYSNFWYFCFSIGVYMDAIDLGTRPWSRSMCTIGTWWAVCVMPRSALRRTAWCSQNFLDWTHVRNGNMESSIIDGIDIIISHNYLCVGMGVQCRVVVSFWIETLEHIGTI